MTFFSQKSLGLEVDNKLNFSEHVKSLVAKCNSCIFLMKQLRALGMNAIRPGNLLCILYIQ